MRCRVICTTFLRVDLGSEQPVSLAEAHGVASIRHAQPDVESMESAVDRLGLRLQRHRDSLGAVAHLFVAQKLKVAIGEVRALNELFAATALEPLGECQ